MRGISRRTWLVEYALPVSNGDYRGCLAESVAPAVAGEVRPEHGKVTRLTALAGRRRVSDPGLSIDHPKGRTGELSLDRRIHSQHAHRSYCKWGIPVKISVVIPVYKSELFIDKTLDEIDRVAVKEGWDLEIVLVNDNSPDNVWQKIRERSLHDPRIKAIALVKNYGQHTANIVGFHYASGDCVVTMDDDLQNPPSEIPKLIEKWRQGHDLVVGTFERKQHGILRRIGSGLMQLINTRIFPSPAGFKHTNFRLIDKAVVRHINSDNSRYPYTSGLVMMFSNNPVNVMVRHDPRVSTSSNYNIRRLLNLAWNIVFYYSTLPVRILLTFGFILSLLSGLYAVFLVGHSMVFGSRVPGWTTLAALIAFSNAVIILILSLLGEYLNIILVQLRDNKHYRIRDEIGIDENA